MNSLLNTYRSPVSPRSLVYFCALDEEAEVHALPGSTAKRRTGFGAWMEALPAEERRRYAGRCTQREWTEAQEGPARQRLLGEDSCVDRVRTRSLDT